MADILIRGMEMPKDGRITIQIGADGAVYFVEKCTIMAEKYEKSSHAVPLPAGHGRLIDADALDRAFTDLRFNSDGTLNHWGDRPGWCMHGYEVEKLIADAPTIVPEEGGGEV